MRKLLIFALPLFLVGCATVNPHSQYYSDQTGGDNVAANPRAILPTGPAEIVVGTNVDADVIKMREMGYALLGYSSFNGPEISDEQIREQARKVHASVVYKYAKYTGSVSTSVPLTTTTVNPTMVNTFGTVTGAGGVATYSGVGYGSTTSTNTTYIPVTTHRSDQFATYWVKLKTGILGAHVIEVPHDIQPKIGTNKGFMISAVERGGPAYAADLLRGDVVLSIAGLDMANGDDLMKALRNNTGQDVDFIVYRDGKTITKSVKLGTPSY